MSNNAFHLDKRRVRASFSQAASGYDAVAVLQREIGRRLLERLDLVKLAPRRILDVGCGTGTLTQHLVKRYKGAEVIGLDFAEDMLHAACRRRGTWERWFGRQSFLCADAEFLPLADGSVDLIFSNLTLQWCETLDRTFAEFRRVLSPGGLVLFTTFGPDTLRELRQSWATVDTAVHVNAFLDMHDVGDALVRARLADPVMDVEHLSLTYREAVQVMRDLKAMGAHNITAGRPRGLMGRNTLQRVSVAYERFRQADGMLPATYEVIYGHAWGTELPQRRPPGGDVTIPLERIGRVTRTP